MRAWGEARGNGDFAKQVTCKEGGQVTRSAWSPDHLATVVSPEGFEVETSLGRCQAPLILLLCACMCYHRHKTLVSM